MIFYFTILILLIIMAIRGILLAQKYKDRYLHNGQNLEGWGIALTIMAGTCLLVWTISPPASRHSDELRIIEFKSHEQTIRSVPGDCPAYIIDAMAKQNAWLAKQQYINKGVWELWVSDSVDKLKPIQ